ncbi:MAG: hypothetical protein AAFQ90_12455, partial [Pseudomonadota bacterium]
MKTKALLVLGAGICALAALPGHSQTSSDAALEASCRATEVTMPDSCPCTIVKAREVGVSDAELASLFKDDGHSQPVDQGKYGAFWQVKSQCIADTMMASLGVSQDNPLPGVPPQMRPQMPAAPQTPPPPPALVTPPSVAFNPPPPPALVTPPSVATSTRSAPPVISTQAQAAEVGLAAASPSHSAIAPAGVATSTKVTTRENGDEVVETKYSFQGSDYYFNYNKALEGMPGVLERAHSLLAEDLARIAEFDGPSNRSYRDEENTFWSIGTQLGPLAPIIASGYTNNRPAGQFLYSGIYDTRLGREIAWSDVFEPRVWNGAMREHYCAGLQAERLAKDTWEYSTFCPEFSALIIDFEPQDDGSMKLSFAAYNGVAGSYAEGPYESQIPLTAELLSAVRPAYRDVFAGVTPSSELPLIKRAGRKHYPAPRYYDRDTVNLDFDYRWDGAQAQSGIDWELKKRAEADYRTVSARANEMVANGSRAPLKFGVLWTSGYRVGKLLVPMTKLILTGDDLTPSLLEHSTDDTILWDVQANKTITYEELFPRDWNTTIRKEFCDQIASILTMRELPQFSQCPSYDDTLISFMDGMEGNHVLMFSL